MRPALVIQNNPQGLFMVTGNGCYRKSVQNLEVGKEISACHFRVVLNSDQ